MCAFCGGGKPATTIEHCPPRAMFQGRQWPKGFEFPACRECNHGTDDEDLLVSWLARMDPFHERGDRDGRTVGLLKAINRQYPGVLARMNPTVREARRTNRRLGIKPQPGQTHQEAGGVKVPDEFHKAVCVLCSKLAKAVYYKETGSIFPNQGCLILNWFTNVDLFLNGQYPQFETLKNLAGDVPKLERGGKYLNDQFEFKLTLAPEGGYFVLQATFGKAFGLLIFGSSVAGRLEATVKALRQKSGHQGPFAVLQSPTLIS